MDDMITFIFIVFSFFIGGLFGHYYGKESERTAIAECEKELPRTIHCKITAVPKDKK